MIKPGRSIAEIFGPVIGFEIVFYCLHEDGEMEFVVAGVVGLGVLVYLGYALFNPDKF